MRALGRGAGPAQAPLIKVRGFGVTGPGPAGPPSLANSQLEGVFFIDRRRVTVRLSKSIARGQNTCFGKDQHAQAQHWLRHAQAQLMHPQAQPYLISPRRRRGGGMPEPMLSLSMHELSLSMPEPMLSLSMLILAKSGQGLTSGWIPLGPVRARRGSSGTRMVPYLSRTPIRVHRVIHQRPSGPVGTYRPHRPKFGQLKKHQICSEMGRESTVWPETKTK